MEQQNNKIIKISFKDREPFLSESWLQCQCFCNNIPNKPYSLSILYQGKEFNYWPHEKNYIFYKKAICFPGHPVVQCLYVGFLASRMLFLTIFSDEMKILKTEQRLFLNKDKGFLLCQTL